MSATGRLIAFEGGEGTGKSTQADLLAAHLDATLTFEPGDTEVGARIRGIVLDPDHPELTPRAEALLMAADRAQHVAEIIRPTLAAGRDVVTDRYLGSSVVYQGIGRDLGIDTVWELSRFATDNLEADLVILLTAPMTEVSNRLDRELDRLEQAGDHFHQRVHDGFLELAQRFDWVVIDGVGAVDQVHARVLAAVEDRLGD